MMIFKKNKNFYVLLLVLLFTVLLSGCMNILAEDLYSLPQLADEYLRLQSKIDEILEQGMELSLPISGVNRQAVQFVDLDGDGINEVVVFFSEPDRELLSLYIFINEGGDYFVTEIIEVRGLVFDSVRYVDMDGDGIAEIVIGYQASLTLRQVEIFSIRDFNAVSLVQTDYIDFIDFDLTGDGFGDAIVISLLAQDNGAEVSLYRLMPDGVLSRASASLSDDFVEYVQIITGRLIDDTPAIFIESEIVGEEGYELITEIFIFHDGELLSTTLN
jgi:hypothetical protein